MEGRERERKRDKKKRRVEGGRQGGGTNGQGGREEGVRNGEGTGKGGKEAGRSREEGRFRRRRSWSMAIYGRLEIGLPRPVPTSCRVIIFPHLGSCFVALVS